MDNVIIIGRWSVAFLGGSYTIRKDDKNMFSGDVASILNKYCTCFNRMKPSYTVASVCLEDAIEQMAKKGTLL